MLDQMVRWNFAKVVFKILVSVFGSPFGVGVLLFRRIDQAHVLYML